MSLLLNDCTQERKHRPHGPRFPRGAAVRAWNAAMACLAGGCAQKEAAIALDSNAPYTAAMVGVIQTGDQSLIDNVIRSDEPELKTVKDVKACADFIARYQQLTPADKAAIGRTIGVGAI